MITTSDFLAALLTDYQADFEASFNRELDQSGVLGWLRTIRSDTKTVTIPFSGGVPTPQDTTGGKPIVYEDMEMYSITGEAKTWQAGVEIQREVFEDDRLGFFNSVPQDLVAGAVNHIGRYAKGLFETPGNAYDGGAFFATNRTIGNSGTIDNLLTGTGTDVPDLQTDLQTAVSKMTKYANDKGVIIGLKPNTIWAPVEIAQSLYQAFNPQLTPGAVSPIMPGATATFSGMGYTVHLVPELTDVNNWYVGFVGSNSNRPLGIILRSEPRLEGTIDVNSYEWRDLKKAQYSTYARYERFVGDPRLLIRIAN